eukprot:7315314-Pyramimonas_sp.AAC.1
MRTTRSRMPPRSGRAPSPRRQAHQPVHHVQGQAALGRRGGRRPWQGELDGARGSAQRGDRQTSDRIGRP